MGLFLCIGDEKVEEVILYGLTAGTEMTSKKKAANDSDLFRKTMSDVRPLKPDNRLQLARAKPQATPLQLLLDEESVLDELLLGNDQPEEHETGEELLFIRPGYPPRLLRRLRRGEFSTADSIDLHHMTEQTAREVLLQFLAHANRRRFGCVRVVHGKGLRSKGQPKLKLMTNAVLRKHPAVLAFASCRPVDGGTGAVNILLNYGRPSAQ